MGYPVGLAGESFHEDAIRGCQVGDAVLIWHELENPYDEEALAVIVRGGKIIGRIPRESWVQDAVHAEGKSCLASIQSIERGRSGALSVVLDVNIVGGPIQTFEYGDLT